MNSHVMWKTVWILISWLLQKPADLDVHYFNSLGMVSYSFKGVYMHSDGFTQVFVQYLFFNMGQVKLSMNKYLMAINLSQGKYKLLPFSHLCMSTPDVL